MELQVDNPTEVKQGIGTWTALLKVITSPGKTFAQLLEAPKTWLPSLYLMLLALVFTLPFIGKYREYTNLVLDKSMALAPAAASGVNLEQMKQLTATISTATTLIGIVLAVFLMPLIYAALLKLLNFIMGEGKV